MQLDYSWTPAQIEKRAARDSLAALSRMGGRYASVPPYNDEPKVVNLTVTFPGALEGRGLGRASGSSLEFDRAAAKVFGEAVERVSALPPADIEAVPRLRYEDLDEDAMDPQLLFTSCRGVRPTREDSIRWMEGLRVGRSGQAKSLVPAKLVYLPYEVADEPIWFLSTSNGLAAGSSPEHAAYAGLLELVERDALMRFWTNPETAAFLPVEAMNDDRLVALCSLAARYGLRPDLVLLSVPFPSVAVVLCYVADTTGYGPHGSIGLKAAGSISRVMKIAD